MADSRQNDDAPDGAIGPLAYASPDTDAKVNEIRREVRRQAFSLHRKLTPLDIIVVSCLLLAILWVLIPLTSFRHPSSLSLNCIVNLRQIGGALQQYASTNDGVYPPRLVDLCSNGCTARLFVCPASETEVPATDGTTPQQTINNILAAKNHVTYVYVVAGVKAKSLRAQAVLAYEPLPNHISGSHAYGTVLFADGHAASLPATTLTKMIQELNAGQNPPLAASGF